MPSYVIPDIHGCYRTFRYMLEDKIGITKNDFIYLLGDYIDRGPDSKKVFDYILTLQFDNYKIIPLLGNHEDMLLKSVSNPNFTYLWEANGAKQTLDSFGVTSAIEIPPKYIYFMQQLPYYTEIDDLYFLVHAGLNFSLKNPLTDKESMLWTRVGNRNSQMTGNKKIIHGHTPHTLEVIQRIWNTPGNTVLPLDGGCVYKNVSGLGNLLAFEVGKNELLYIQNKDF